MSSDDSNLVKELAAMCELNFRTPESAGPYFWSNVVKRILTETAVPTAAHGEALVSQLAQIEWEAARMAHPQAKLMPWHDLAPIDKEASFAGTRAILSALSAMPLELPSADAIAQAWNHEPSPVAPKVNVLNMLRAHLAPILATHAATMPSIEDFAEALDLAATALPYESGRTRQSQIESNHGTTLAQPRKYNFDERFGRLTAKLELLRPGMVVGASVVDQALAAAETTKDVVETSKRATLMERFHDATGTKDSDDYRTMSLGDIRELIKLLDAG